MTIVLFMYLRDAFYVTVFYWCYKGDRFYNGRRLKLCVTYDTWFDLHYHNERMSSYSHHI